MGKVPFSPWKACDTGNGSLLQGPAAAAQPFTGAYRRAGYGVPTPRQHLGVNVYSYGSPSGLVLP